MSIHKPPAHIGGYQHLASDIEAVADDICVENGVVACFVGKDAGHTVRWLEAELGMNIYRLIPVAKQGDIDNTGWKKVAAEASKPILFFGESYDSKPAAIVARAMGCNVLPQDAKAATYDDGKPPLACLPLKALREVSLVQLYGHKKYGDFYNYRKGMELSRNASCAMRHIADFMDGQDLDSESKCNHLAHAACRLLFMLENLAEKTAIDDRYKKL